MSGQPEIQDGYELCPDCRGTKYRNVMISAGDDYSARVSSLEPCFRCGFTGIVMKVEPSSPLPLSDKGLGDK